MKLKCWLAAMAGAAGLGFVALPAQAASPGGLGANALNAAAAQTTDVQKAHWDGRRYRYRYYYGPRYYRYHYRPGYRYYYGHRHHRHYHRYW